MKLFFPAKCLDAGMAKSICAIFYIILCIIHNSSYSIIVTISFRVYILILIIIYISVGFFLQIKNAMAH